MNLFENRVFEKKKIVVLKYKISFYANKQSSRRKRNQRIDQSSQKTRKNAFAHRSMHKIWASVLTMDWKIFDDAM